MERKPGYQVQIYVKRLPESFRGPQIFKKALSYLSEFNCGSIGDGYPGMDIEEAKKIAQEECKGSYTDAKGHLRSSRGVIVRVS